MRDVGAHRLPDITGQLRFTDVGFSPLGKAAGISGFDGDDRGPGRAAASSSLRARRDYRLAPAMARAGRDPKRGDGRVEWQRFGDGVRFWLDDAFADTGHGIARGKLRMVLRPGESPLMDVSATADGFRRDPALALPADRSTVPDGDPLARRGLPRRPRDRGTVSPLPARRRGFPYREGQGVFRASGRAAGIDLFYAPGWPDLRGIRRRFQLRRPGTARGCEPWQHRRHRLHRRRGEQWRPARGDLRARGKAETDAGRAIRMLQATPLAPSFGAMFADFRPPGRCELNSRWPCRSRTSSGASSP